MKKGAIFDMDGLLFDTERLYRDTWTVLAGEFGQVHDPAFPKAISGTSGETMRAVIRKHYPAVDAEEFIAECYRRVDALEQISIPEKKGMRAILEGLHRAGLRLAVASSSGMEMIRRNLRVAGIEGYFDAVISGTNLQRGKPFPDIFLAAAEALELPPEECYVFEDSLNGVRAGVAAGCVSVMIPDLTEPTEDILASAAAICPDLDAALADILDGKL